MTHFLLNSFRFTIRFFHSILSFFYSFFVTLINIILLLFEILPFDRINLPSLLVTSFHLNYPLFTLTMVCNPFHGRYLSSNSITSIPSGGFTGLTALNTLWGRRVVLHLCGSIVFSCILEFLHCFRYVCSHMGIFSMGPLWINITIFSPLIIISFLEKNLLLSPAHNLWAVFPFLANWSHIPPNADN
jgi:hypothetical protein